MKIAIASDDGRTVASHFGRTRGFAIFEIAGREIKSRTFAINDFTGHARGLEEHSSHADRHGPVLAALEGCSAVISRGMGRRMYDDLRSAGIESLITVQTQVEETLNAYLEGTLEDHPGRGCNH